MRRLQFIGHFLIIQFSNDVFHPRWQDAKSLPPPLHSHPIVMTLPIPSRATQPAYSPLLPPGRHPCARSHRGGHQRADAAAGRASARAHEAGRGVVGAGLPECGPAGRGLCAGPVAGDRRRAVLDTTTQNRRRRMESAARQTHQEKLSI